MSLKNLVYEYLGGYKGNFLNIEENGTFHYQGKDIPKARILQKKHRENNIVGKYRNRFFASNHPNIELQEYSRHLNSSQALCKNLSSPAKGEMTHATKNFILDR